MTPIDDNELSIQLLSEMAEAGLISQSTVKLYESRNKLHSALNESASASTPHQYFYSHDGIEVTIPWARFKDIYLDYYNYPTTADVMQALGFPVSVMTSGTLSRRLLGIRDHFASDNDEARKIGIPKPGNRQKWWKRRSESQDGGMPEADSSNIDPGRRGKTSPSTKTTDMLNNQAVVPGQFYADISRIPRRRWGGWIRFWERQVSRIKNPKSLVGRVWGKTFIMGYQLERNMVIEIWYNSATSDFSVYDQNGIELGRPTKTLQETIRFFVTYLVKEHESDREVFGANRNQVAQSFMNSLRNGLQKDAVEAEREADLAAQEQKATAQAGTVVDVVRRSVDNAKAKYNQQQRNKQEEEEERKKRNATAWNSASQRNADGSQSQEDREEERRRSKEHAERKRRATQASNRAWSGRDQEPEDDVIHMGSDEAGDTYDHDEIMAKQRADDLKAKKYANEKAYQAMKDREKVQDERKASERKGDFEFDPFRDHEAETLGISSGVLRDLAQEYRERKRQYEELKKAEEREKENVIALRARASGPNTEAALNRASQKHKQIQIKRREQRQLTDEQWREIERQARELGISPPDAKRALGESFDEVFKGESLVEDEQRDEFVDKILNEDEFINAYIGDKEGRRKESDFDPATMELDREAVTRRKMAQNSGFTTSSIKASVMSDMITVYDETRVPARSSRASWFINKFFRGRAREIVLPQEDAGWFDRMRMAMLGVRYRADFVIGFSLRESVNVEIWYITEPSRNDPSKHISSFYVYDVTSETLIRANLPYYRNAVQTAMSKIGVS